MYNYINETRKYLSFVQTLLEWGGQVIYNPTHNSWFLKEQKKIQLPIHEFMNRWKQFFKYLPNQKILISFALQAFSYNSNQDWIIRFVHHNS